MPGVPSEMKRMFQQEILPRLSGSGRVIRHARINCFGIGESDAEAKLGELTARGGDPEVGITVHEATITLRITAHGRDEAECQRKIDGADLAVRQRLGELVFGVEDEELEHVVVRMLQERGETLATAEAGTGGLLAHRLTDVTGGFSGGACGRVFDATASARSGGSAPQTPLRPQPTDNPCYLGGVVVPTDRAKRELLGVDPEILKSHGPLSAEAAAAMAAGCRERFRSDYALSVTECPWFDADDPQAESPTVYVALAGEGVLKTQPHRLIGDPAIAKSRAAKMGLNMLRLWLLGGGRTRPLN